jgi:choline dehydrogenase-like flavoprotein
MNLVVGSGPAGVAAALALLERGRAVTMLDFGRTIEPEFSAAPAQLAGLPFESWPLAAHAKLAAITGPIENGFPMKTNFGSDFAYRESPDLMPVERRGADILYSLARGGLSNLWGANVVSFCDADFAGWPLDGAAFADSYRAVLRHVPLSAERGDDFEAMMPLHTERLEPRPLSEQAAQMLRDLQSRREQVHARGFRFGPSRLALRTSASERDPGCVRCGLCLHGCPYDLIYSSAQTLATLEGHPRFRYVSGLFVTRVVEHEGGVEVQAMRGDQRERVSYRGERVFLGCGGFSSARLLLESLERYDFEVTMLESQYFLIPLLSWKHFPDAQRERLTTLSQVCLRLSDRRVSRQDVHMLLYSYNSLYRPVLRSTPARFLPPLEGQLLGRLLSLQGYLHSDESPRLAIALRRAAAGPPLLSVEGRANAGTAGVIRRVEARVRGLSGALRASPIPFMTRVGRPGKSYHSGGTFPMRRDPGERESDLLGRPMGLRRVHVVDSSVFPTIPATNLTLTVMANAYRIATASAELDPATSAADSPGDPR